MAALAADKKDMDYLDAFEESRGGFNFENFERNSRLVSQLEKGRYPTAKKTGTTICGIIIKDGVCLAADTRATAGSIVADKNAAKLHYITPNIYCAGAGTSADLGATTELMMRNMELHALNTGTKPRVCTVVKRLSNMLFKYQGHVGCALVLGGVDITGPHLYQIYPHGSTDQLPYTTMGSGSLAAMSVLEMNYKEGLSPEEGMKLVADAIEAGVMNDLGSGGNIDVCCILKDPKTGVVGEPIYKRAFRSPCPRVYRGEFPVFKAGTTPLLGKPEVRKFIVADGDDADVVMAQ